MAKENVTVETSKVGGPGLIECILGLGPIVAGSNGSAKSSGKTESESVANAMRDYSRR